jgi:GNAT superfamily N-acetyltransferase
MKLDWARKYAISVQPISGPYDWVCVRRMLQEHAAEVTQWLEQGTIIDLNPELRRELKDTAGTYQREGATVLLARLDGLCTGMVVLKRLDGDTAEVGRLYSRPQGKKSGAERLLLEAALATAYDRGIRRIVLDRATATSPEVAALVKSAGSTPTTSRRNPDARVQLVLDRARTSTTEKGVDPHWVPTHTNPSMVRSDVLAHSSGDIYRGAGYVAGALAQ